jgi:GNAT superfamily N-acetyltransferase
VNRSLLSRYNQRPMKNVTYCEQAPDREAYFALFETTGWNSKYKASPEDLAQALGNSWYTLSAYDKGELVGFGRVLCDGALHAMIFDLIVHPSHQRRGIGSEILKRLLSVCRDADIPDVQLFAANGMAPFYEKHGFNVRPDQGPGMELSTDS